MSVRAGHSSSKGRGHKLGEARLSAQYHCEFEFKVPFIVHACGLHCALVLAMHTMPPRPSTHPTPPQQNGRTRFADIYTHAGATPEQAEQRAAVRVAPYRSVDARRSNKAPGARVASRSTPATAALTPQQQKQQQQEEQQQQQEEEEEEEEEEEKSLSGARKRRISHAAAAHPSGAVRL